MSHVTLIDLLVKDLDALDKACGRMGLELVRGQKTFKWFGRFMYDSPGIKGVDPAEYGKCDHAIRVKGNKQAYEIGLVARKDGKGYELRWDNWRNGFGLCAATGYDVNDTSGNKLKDWYAAEVARKQMSRQGFRVQMKQQERKVQVLCSK